MVPRFTPVADHALLVTFGDAIDDASHEAVLALDQRLSDDPPAGMIQAVPALVNLLVEFDPLATTHDAIRAAVAARLGGGPSANQGTVRRVEVCYDGNLAPDLCALADATGLTLEGVINAHLSGDYRVMMYGFSPGYAYMAGVPDAIQVPRKRAAVRDVPAGSVIVAGPQCLITTLTMPTGWTIIGRSPTAVLTGDPAAPFLFAVGDQVTWERIDRATYDKRLAALRDG